MHLKLREYITSLLIDDKLKIMLVGSRLMGYSTKDSDWDTVVIDYDYGQPYLIDKFEGSKLFIAFQTECDFLRPLMRQGEFFQLPYMDLQSGRIYNWDDKTIEKWKNIQLKLKNRLPNT